MSMYVKLSRKPSFISVLSSGFYCFFQLKPCRTYLQEHLNPKYIAKNPLYTVPFLEDSDVSMTDSHAITQYLVETRAPTSTLIAHNPRERAILNDRLFFDTLLFQKCKAIMVRDDDDDTLYRKFSFEFISLYKYRRLCIVEMNRRWLKRNLMSLHAAWMRWTCT